MSQTAAHLVDHVIPHVCSQQLAGTTSGGEQQMVAVARALVSRQGC